MYKEEVCVLGGKCFANYSDNQWWCCSQKLILSNIGDSVAVVNKSCALVRCCCGRDYKLEQGLIVWEL